MGKNLATPVKPPAKKADKSQREKDVLLGLINYYIETGKPVGSNTLKEAGFDHLSSATIRNYYSKLEDEGYLHQPHTSGGRIPTEKAFRLFAQEYVDHPVLESRFLKEIQRIKELDTREVQLIIRQAVEELSHLAEAPAFISAPRFDSDFIIDFKVIPIDTTRVVCILITDFGTIQTEVITVDQKLSSHSAKRIELYLRSRLAAGNLENLEPEEFELAQRIYNEVMVRFLVGYTNFTEEEILTTGFSKLLHYPESLDPAVLAESLAIFENPASLRHLLRESLAHGHLCYLIGSDLLAYGAKTKETAILTIPYAIHNQWVGAIGILGPLRIPYRKLFGLMKTLREALSQCLTKNLYKFKVTYRQPELKTFMLPESKTPKLTHYPTKLIETRNPHEK